MGSSPLIEVIEELGLVTREDIARFFRKASSAQIKKAESRLADAASAKRPASVRSTPTLFNYVASASIRGESHCAEPECRANNVAELARFSLLYADKVIMPILGRGRGSLALQGDLMILSELRPLIDLGVIIPTCQEMCLCPECAERFKSIKEEVDDFVCRAADDLAEIVTVSQVENIGKLQVRDLPQTRDLCFLQVDWPSDFEETRPSFLITRDPYLIARIGKLKRPGAPLPKKLIRDSALLVHYLQRPAADYLLHRAVSSAAEWRYLSDSILETRLFGNLAGGSELERSQNRVLAEMSHEIPLFANVSLGTLMEVRRQEGDLFGGYRSALNDAMSEAMRAGGSPKTVREIFRDVVAPKLNALEVRERTLRKRLGKNVLLSYLPSAVTLAVGLIASAEGTGVGNLAGKLVEAFGLGALCTQFIQQGSAADSIKSDPFYFLLKLQKAHEKRCAE